MAERPEHGMARSELDQAREYVHEQNYPEAAHHVRIAKIDVDDNGAVDYGEWRERFDELAELFEKGITWRSRGPTGPRSGSAYTRATDGETLLEILDELEETLGEMDRLKKDFRERYAATGSPSWTARGWAQDGDLGLTEDDVPEDQKRTCVGCRRGVTQLGAMYFYLKNHPGDRLLCGECLFEMDVVDREDAGEIEIELDTADGPELNPRSDRLRELRDRYGERP